MVLRSLIAVAALAVGFTVSGCRNSEAAGGGNDLSSYFKDLPAGKDPGTISRRITDQFLSSRPEKYRPRGYHGNNGYGGGKHVQYSVVSLWVNAIECARLAGDKAREAKLTKLFDDFLPGKPKNYCCSQPYHVDDTIFGALPLEIALANGASAAACREMGLKYADTQWTAPCEGTIKARNRTTKEEQEAFWAQGYTPQTRLWIDDMYMITLLQSQAYRLTGERKYIDRAAHEMCLYLDKLQLKDGKAKGLFYHAPDVPFVWGRGDGWMAAGMALVLNYLPENSEYRARILKGYREMMAALLKFQRADGLWCQLVDMPEDPRNWGETSSTAMFTYAFVTGIESGWLDGAVYGPAARKAYLALCGRLDEFANVGSVCVGTGKKNDLQYYFDRPQVNGDPHGQAPILWIASKLLEAGAGKVEGLHTPMTSKHFERRIDPESGVVSYVLSGGLDENYQSLYFTAKSMTDDGRFLVFDISPNERRHRNARADKKTKDTPFAKRKLARHKAVLDFKTDEIIELPETDGKIPFVDTKANYMVYVNNNGFFKRELANPRNEIKLCDVPKEVTALGKVRYWCTHLTLTKDRSRAFIDSCVITPQGATNCVQGTVELATGKYTSWGKTDFFANHGQLNPADDNLALCAWECAWMLPDAKEYRKRTGWYPRMWLVYPDGKREMVPARKRNGASHECWAEDGKGFYWCGSGVHYQALKDLKSGKQECICPELGAHASMSADNKYVVYDESRDGWYRGCRWRVGFWNRETSRKVYVYSTRPALLPKYAESGLHPDPHPQFVMGDKYVVSTANNARGNMELFITPVDQLIARTTAKTPTGKRVVVTNPIKVDRPGETITLEWNAFGIAQGDPATRVWDVKEDRPVAWQDIGKGKFIFSTALGAGERREFVVTADAKLPAADLSTVCWSQYLPERMDDYAWENDRFGARAYGPVIMEPKPAGQSLVSSGIDIINKCVKYPVLHRWFVQRTGEGSYHKFHGEGMDNYKVGPSRGCGGIAALGADGWKFSINWQKSRTYMNGPCRTQFELVYPAWGGFGEERRVVTLDRGQYFARFATTFAGKRSAGVKVGPGLDCAAARQHDGNIQRDMALAYIANFEPGNVDGPNNGHIMTAILLAPEMGEATTAVDALGCEYLFPAPEKTAKGPVYYAGAAWSGDMRVKDAKSWHKLVKDFAAALRAPVKVEIK